MDLDLKPYARIVEMEDGRWNLWEMPPALVQGAGARKPVPQGKDRGFYPSLEAAVAAVAQPIGEEIYVQRRGEDYEERYLPDEV